MSGVTSVSTTNAPPPAVPVYSQATVHKATGTVYVSGQMGMRADTKTFAEGTVGARADQCLRNLEEILKAAGSGLDKVLRCNVYVLSMSDFKEVNEVYGKWFTGEHKPARTTVAVKELPLGTDVEVDCVACL